MLVSLLVILKSQCYKSLAIPMNVFMASQSIKGKGKDSKECKMSKYGDCLKNNGPFFALYIIRQENVVSLQVPIRSEP